MPPKSRNSKMNIYSLTEMEKPTKMQCYLCQSTKDLLDYDDEDGICKPCYQEQVQTMLEFKKKRTTKYPEIDQIAEGIFLGNEDAATSPQILEAKKITAICVCGAHLDTPFLEDQKYTYKLFHIQDFPKQTIIQYFPEHYSWMKQMQAQNKNILVHCAAGVSRSASFVIAFLMKDQQLPFHKAYEYVKSKRKWANPNSGFKAQLKEYNSQLGLPPVPENDIHCSQFY